jgi:hypothetical protein
MIYFSILKKIIPNVKMMRFQKKGKKSKKKKIKIDKKDNLYFV